MDVKKRSGNYIKFFIYLVVIILINVAGTTLFFRVDLTQDKIYSISEISQRVIATLSEPLTINVFFTKNLPAPHNNTERYLHDLLKEYSIYANKYFNYRFYDVSPEEGDISQEAKKNQELAQDYGIHPVQVQVVEKDEVKFQRAYMGLVLIHGDIIERIPTIASTDGLEYQLTTAIRKLNNKISALLRLPQKIRIRLFLSSSLKIVAPYIRLDQLPGLPVAVESIVEKLNSANYGKLEFEYLDPSKDETLEADLTKYNILSLRWPALSDGEIQPGQGAIGLVMLYGDKAISIPLVHVLQIPLIGRHYELVDMNELEEIINQNVESLIDINEELGYLAGHGTLRLSSFSLRESAEPQRQDVLSNFEMLTSQNYSIREFSLEDGTMPDSFNCAVIAGPTESFTDYELFQIDQFLMRGKSLALFLDAFKEVAPPQQQPFGFNRPSSYVAINTGLEKLLEHYGVRLKKSYVMDEYCYRQRVPDRFGGGETPFYFAPIIQSQNINNDLGFMRNIKGLVAMTISPLALNTERIKENGLNARKVFSSSAKSWEMKGQINLHPRFIRPPESSEEQESFPLAYILEGEFPSYFAGKPIPEKKSEETDAEDNAEKPAGNKPDVDLSQIESKGEFLLKGKPGKIFIMASSEMLKDNVLDEQGRSPNAMFIMNVLDYLNNLEGIALMRSKEQRFNPLHDTKAGTKVFVKSFNIAGMPVLVILFGLMVWFRRHSRKKRIQMMFQR
jgi:ABC-2 type transport system permease protein